MGDINTNIRIDELESDLKNVDSALSSVANDVSELQRNPVIKMLDIEFTSTSATKTYTNAKVGSFFQTLHQKKPAVMYLLDTVTGNRYQLTQFEEISESGTDFVIYIRRTVSTNLKFTKLEWIKGYSGGTDWTLLVSEIT